MAGLIYSHIEPERKYTITLQEENENRILNKKLITIFCCV